MLFILPLVKSFDIRGKNMLSKHHQAFALLVLQQVLNCLLSPALFPLTEDQTSFCHLRLCTAPRSCLLTVLPRFYMQTLVTGISDLTTEMTQKPGNIDEGGQKPCMDLYLLSCHLSDMAWVIPAASKTDWKPNPWHYLLWCTGVAILTLRLQQSHKSWLVQQEGHAFKVTWCCFAY